MESNRPDYESALLGGLMLHGREGVKQVAEFLRPHHFHKTHHQHVYGAILSVFIETVDPVDSLTVIDWMKKHGTIHHTSESELLSLTIDNPHLIPSEYSVGTLGRMVAEKGTLSLVHNLLISAKGQCEDSTADVFDIIVGLQQKLDDYSMVGRKMPIVPATSGLTEVMEHVEQMARGDKKAWGTPTGFPSLDYYLYGLEPKNLYIVAGRPSHGKTSFAMQIAEQITRTEPMGIFSMEMALTELIIRMLATRSGIPYQSIKAGRLSKDELEYVMGKAVELGHNMSNKLFVADSAGLSVAEIRIYTMLAKEKWGIKGIMIDYLQLINMDERNMNRDQQIGKTTRALKALAKELNIWVVLLSQLSRAVEQRTDRRPQLSDLRESGNIEQDADTILFVWRPILQGVKTLTFYGEEIDDTKDLAMLIVGKQRNGQIGDLLFRFDGPRTMFTERFSSGTPSIPVTIPQSNQLPLESDDNDNPF